MKFEVRGISALDSCHYIAREYVIDHEGGLRFITQGSMMPIVLGHAHDDIDLRTVNYLKIEDRVIFERYRDGPIGESNRVLGNWREDDILARVTGSCGCKRVRADFLSRVRDARIEFDAHVRGTQSWAIYAKGLGVLRTETPFVERSEWLVWTARPAEYSQSVIPRTDTMGLLKARIRELEASTHLTELAHSAEALSLKRKVVVLEAEKKELNTRIISLESTMKAHQETIRELLTKKAHTPTDE